MSDQVAVRIENVSKKFCRKLKKSLWYGAQDITRELLGRRSTNPGLRPDEFWAVQDISFEVNQGECVALLGPNGAGKSTLLKMMSGLIKPNQGTIHICGRVGALIELGAGFNPILTGRENIYINASILGFSKKETDSLMDIIIEFSGIGNFIDTPVQSYSSGMRVRLGFSIAAHLRLDILLIDEVLAVGDIRFQRKSFRKMKELIMGHTTVIIVSHNVRTIQDLAQRSILLNRGNVIKTGSSPEVVKEYINITNEEEEKDKNIKSIDSWINQENKAIHVRKVEILNKENEFCLKHKMNEPLRIRIHYKVHNIIDKADFQVTVYTADNTIVSCCNSKFSGFGPFKLDKDGYVDLIIDEELMPGNYRLAGSIFDNKHGEPIDIWGTTDDRYIDFMVESVLSKKLNIAFWNNLGVINMKHTWHKE